MPHYLQPKGLSWIYNGNTMTSSELLVLKDSNLLAQEAAKHFIEIAKASLASHQRFTVALSGGSTPQKLYKLLASDYKHALDWSKVFVFFGDERFVPPYESESNYAMADEVLLSRIDLPEDNIFPFATIDISPEDAGHLYEKELKKFFGDQIVFDLIFLGLGEDGHTASLFPGHPEVVNPSASLVKVVEKAPKAPATRLSFTYKLINQAQNVIFLVAGQGKAKALKNIFEGPGTVPAALVKPEKGKLVWLLDEEAAKDLKLET